jgi:hypothetical protein
VLRVRNHQQSLLRTARRVVHGDLIGINTAIVTGGSGGNQGVGFAIPVNMAREVLEQIVDHGKVIRGHLGVAIQSVDADMAKAFSLIKGGGALVSEVTPGSPAAKAGIEGRHHSGVERPASECTRRPDCPHFTDCPRHDGASEDLPEWPDARRHRHPG